ncbi:hypothetical protein WP7W18E02_24220 [Aeromonas media]|nr:hypothetical protein WP7W18E02_24220 [Aeromonas media]
MGMVAGCDLPCKSPSAQGEILPCATPGTESR